MNTTQPTAHQPATDAKEAILHVLGSPATSYWLRDALRTALGRDCVEAAYDAEHLARLLGDYRDEIVRDAQLG